MGAAAATIGANTVGARMPSMSGIVPPTSDTQWLPWRGQIKVTTFAIGSRLFPPFFQCFR